MGLVTSMSPAAKASYKRGYRRAPPRAAGPSDHVGNAGRISAAYRARSASAHVVRDRTGTGRPAHAPEAGPAIFISLSGPSLAWSDCWPDEVTGNGGVPIAGPQRRGHNVRFRAGAPENEHLAETLAGLHFVAFADLAANRSVPCVVQSA